MSAAPRAPRAPGVAFALPPGTGVAELAALLAPLGRLAAGAARRRRATLLDTFDGRAHRAGLLLAAGVAARGARLAALPLGGGRPAASARGPAPRFARELAPGPLRERLLPLLEPRALLPLAELEVEAIPLELRLRVRRGRARVALALELARSGEPGEAASRELAPTLRLAAGAGGERVAALLAAVPGVAPAPPDALAAALEPLGRTPRELFGKAAAAIAPAMPAREAARAVLLAQLREIERNLPGVREDLDPEFLHDLRVAVRRSRSALGQLKGVFPEASARRFGAQLRRLQETTGPARDLDVFVHELPALAGLLPARARRSLGPLARLLARRRAAAHEALRAELADPRLGRFLEAWRAFLARPAPRRPRGAPEALAPARALAARRIGKLYRRAVAEGRAVTERSPAAQLHELRKTCKKLRYLLELFGPLFDREAVRGAVEALKGLQDDLGRHQDLQVQAAALLGYARELAAEGRARPPAYVALGMLVERLRERQGAARAEFAGRFRPFAARENRRRMKALLADEG